jgi:hypothetical protein
MKNICLLVVFLMGISTASFSQSAGGTGSERVSRGSKKEKSSKPRKPRKQNTHFDGRKSDPKVKSNGTSYRMERRRELYQSENNGFGVSKRGKK